MTIEVRATPIADRIIGQLPRKARRSYDEFEAQLEQHDCEALAYRLTGDQIDHLCIVHLIGQLRVVVAFESPKIAYIVLIGRHDEQRPELDVYEQLYALAGHSPPDQASRDKPPCCDTETGLPPVETELLDQLLQNMRHFRASDVRRAGRRQRAQSGRGRRRTG